MRTAKLKFAVFLFLAILFFQGIVTCKVKAGETARSLIIRIKGENGSMAQAVKLYGSSYALLIGMSHYTTGWPNLPGVIRDLKDVKNELEKQGFTVIVIQNPDSAHLKAGIDDFINSFGLDPENRLIIYFAGHGHTEKLVYGTEMGYIVPTDAPIPYRDKKGFFSKALSMQAFETYAKDIHSKHALFIFDSCFSGAIFAINRAVPEVISYKTTNPVRQFLTAGAADEKVPDESIFKSQFIAGIRGEADGDRDGYVTGTELGNFIETKVVNYSKGCQHPQYGTIKDPNLDRGDFVFQCGKAQVEEPPVRAYEPVFPPKSEVDLSGYKNESEKNREAINKEKAEWASWQAKFREKVDEAKSLEADPNLSAASKNKAWEKVLSAYGVDNPYSSEDETFRQYAKGKIQGFENQISSEELSGLNTTFAPRWSQDEIVPKPPPPNYTLYLRNHEFEGKVVSVRGVICVSIEPFLIAMNLKWKQTESNVVLEPIPESIGDVHDSAAIAGGAITFSYKGKSFNPNQFWRNGTLFVALTEMTKGLNAKYDYNSKTGIADAYYPKSIDYTGITYRIIGDPGQVSIVFWEHGEESKTVASLPWIKTVTAPGLHEGSRHIYIEAEYTKQSNENFYKPNKKLTIEVLVDGKLWQTTTSIEPDRASCSGELR